MRRIIWNIITVLAVLNLIWLFVFNYKIPALPSFSSNQKEEAVVTEEEVPEEETEETGEIIGEETAESSEEEQPEAEPAEKPEEQAETETAEAEGENQEPASDTTLQCRINDGYNARIRSGPGTDYDIVTEMKSGSILTITGELVNGWYPIRTEDGQEGYIYSELVTLVEPAEEAGQAAETVE